MLPVRWPAANGHPQPAGKLFGAVGRLTAGELLGDFFGKHGRLGSSGNARANGAAAAGTSRHRVGRVNPHGPLGRCGSRIQTAANVPGPGPAFLGQQERAEQKHAEHGRAG